VQPEPERGRAEEKQAAQVVQARQRGRGARKDMSEQQDAAAKVQAIQRGRQARQRAGRIRASADPVAELMAEQGCEEEETRADEERWSTSERNLLFLDDLAHEEQQANQRSVDRNRRYARDYAAVKVGASILEPCQPSCRFAAGGYARDF
jgi:hypothetical protein